MVAPRLAGRLDRFYHPLAENEQVCAIISLAGTRVKIVDIILTQIKANNDWCFSAITA